MMPPGRRSDSNTRQPARRISQMMQHSNRFNAVEAAADRSELQDIGLAVIDVSDVGFAGLSQRIGQAGAAQIDGEHARLGKLQSGLDRVLAGAAPGYQDFQGTFVAIIGVLNGKTGAPIAYGRDVRDRGPSRVGIFLILLLDSDRYIIVDNGQRLDRAAKSDFLKRLDDLLLQQAIQRARPIPVPLRRRCRQRVEGEIGGDGDQQQFRYRASRCQALDHKTAKAFRLPGFIVALREQIFVNETLLCHRGKRSQAPCPRGEPGSEVSFTAIWSSANRTDAKKPSNSRLQIWVFSARTEGRHRLRRRQRHRHRIEIPIVSRRGHCWAMRLRHEAMTGYCAMRPSMGLPSISSSMALVKCATASSHKSNR